MIKIVWKKWGINSKRWIEKIKILWFFHFYKYSLQGEKNYYRFFLREKRFISQVIPMPKYYIYQEEIDKEYGGNKWIVPVNRTFEKPNQ